MIKQIVKVLKEIQEISGYKVIENTEQSNQAFYVLGKLETVRLVETKEAIVTIYHNNGEYLGTSSFIVSHNLTKKALMEKISDAIFAAKFVKNKPFELVKGETSKVTEETFFDTVVPKIQILMVSDSTYTIHILYIKFCYSVPYLFRLKRTG